MSVLDCPARSAGDGAVDGGDNTSWATARAQPTGLTANAAGTTGFWCPYCDNNAASARIFYMIRGFLPIDISGLANAVVSAATLTLTINGNAYNLSGGSLCLVGSTQASATALSTSDFSAVGSTEFATRQSFASMSTNGTVTLTLNSAGLAALQAAINASATTFFLAIRTSQDLDNSAPSSGNYSGTFMRSNEDATPANRPKLTVTYTTSTSVGKSCAMPYAKLGTVNRSWAQPFNEHVGWPASFHGAIYNSVDTSWAALKAASVGTSVSQGSLPDQWMAWIERKVTAPRWNVIRGILVFDLTNLPALGPTEEYIPGGVSLRVHTQTGDVFASGGGSIVVREATLASDTAVATSDWPSIGTTDFGRFQYWPTGVIQANDYYDLVLNAAGTARLNDILHAGGTKFKLAILTSFDADNTDPGASALQAGFLAYGVGYSDSLYTTELRFGTRYNLVGRSAALPSTIINKVGASVAMPSYIDSPRVANVCPMPYLVYNFALGGRGFVTAQQTVRLSPVAGVHQSHNSFPSMVRVDDPAAPFGKLVLKFRQGNTHGDYVGPDGSSGYDGKFMRKQSINLGTAWTDKLGNPGTGTGSEDQVLTADTANEPTADDLRSNFTHIDPYDGAMVTMWYQRSWGGGRTSPTPTIPYDGALDWFRSFCYKSYDDGITWTKVGEITGETLGFDTPGIYSQFNAGSFLILPTGRYLVFGEGRKSVNYTGSDTTWMHGKWGYSDDRGATWNLGGDLATVAQTAPGGVATSNYEHEGILLDNGRVLVVIRVQDHITGNRAHYYSTYMDPPYTSFVTPFKIIDSVTNRPALLQTVAGDVLLISSGQGWGGVYASGISVWQSKSRGDVGTWSLATTNAGSNYNGAWLCEATKKDSDGNVLLSWAEEFASQTQANVYFRKLSSAASVPPHGEIAPTGSSTAMPWKDYAAVGRSVGVPYAITATIGRSVGLPSKIQNVVGRSESIPYNVNTSAGRSAGLPYGVIGFVGRSFGLPSGIAGVTGHSWPMPANVLLTATGPSCSMPYIVKQSAGRSFSQPSTVRNLAGQGWSQPSVVAGAAGRSYAQPYTVFVKFIIGASYPTPFSITGIANRSWSMRYRTNWDPTAQYSETSRGRVAVSRTGRDS